MLDVRFPISDIRYSKFDNQQDWIEQEKLLKHPDYQKALIGEDEYEFKLFD